MAALFKVFDQYINKSSDLISYERWMKLDIDVKLAWCSLFEIPIDVVINSVEAVYDSYYSYQKKPDMPYGLFIPFDDVPTRYKRAWELVALRIKDEHNI